MTRPPPARDGLRASEKHAESLRLVVRALRHALERGELANDTADNITRLTLAQLVRPGAVGHGLSPQQREALAAELHPMVQGIALVPRDLYRFARAATDVAQRLHSRPRHPGAAISARIEDPRALAKAALFAEAMQSNGDEDLVRRAVARAVRESRRARRGVAVQLADGAPLRALFDLPERGLVRLPRNDVRTRLCHAAQTGPFGQALSEVALFSEDRLRPILGSFLYTLARPVAFSGRRHEKVIVEVASSVHAHEAQLSSTAILHALRAVPEFAHVEALDILVKPKR